MSTVEIFSIIGTILGILGGLLGAFIWLLRNHSHLDRLRKQEEDSQREIGRLKNELNAAHQHIQQVQDTDSLTISKLQNAFPQIFHGGDVVRELASSIREARRLLRERDEAIQKVIAQNKEEIHRLKKLQKDLGKNLSNEQQQHNRLESELKAKEKQLAELNIQAEMLTKINGRTWLQPVASNHDKFWPFGQRKPFIISVVNFKGGVGKTTVSANLAATWGQLGKRVLMIDLDYQRSLSLMFVPSDQRGLLYDQKRCLQHYLSNDDPSGNTLVRCLHPLGDPARNCSIVINSDPPRTSEVFDGLEDVESNLMVDWLLQRSRTDVRLLLRKGLHDEAISHRFDYILLDCPPRLTTACINALAASDAILIPVILDELSAPSIDHLLKSLQRLRSSLLSKIQMVGIVANKVKFLSDKLIQAHQAVWEKLQAGKAKLWGTEVFRFDSQIPINNDIAKIGSSIDDKESSVLELAVKFEPIRKAFSKLASELDTHIEEMKNHEGSYTSTISP